MRHFDALRRTALATICSVAMVCSSLAPMAVQAGTDSVKVFDSKSGEYIELKADHTKDDAFGDSVVYDAESRTLTLTNASLSCSANNIDVITTEDNGGNLTIVLVGNNTVTNNNFKTGDNWNEYNDGIMANGVLTIKGSGTLTVNSLHKGAGLNTRTGGITITGDTDENGNVTSAPTVFINANGDYGINSAATMTVTKGARLYVDGFDTQDAGERDYANVGIQTRGDGTSGWVTVDNATLEVVGYTNGIQFTQAGSLVVTDSKVKVESAAVEWDETDNIWKNAVGTVAIIGNSHTHGDYPNTTTCYTSVSVTGASEFELIGGTNIPSNAVLVTSSKLTDDLVKDGVDKITLDVEYGTTRYEEDATPAEDNGETSPFVVTTKGGKKAHTISNANTLFYIHTKDSMFNRVKTSEWHEGHHCNHVYEWEVYQQATATNDGIMRYRCKYCGDVQYEVPVTAYYMFNKNTQEAILKAEQGATVTTETALFISFHDMVQKALEQRPDVTLVVDYRNDGKNYEMTIPAGSAEQLDTLFGDSQFAGFLYLGGTYATTELPEDWEFTTVPASVVWFGATNAH